MFDRGNNLLGFCTKPTALGIFFTFLCLRIKKFELQVKRRRIAQKNMACAMSDWHSSIFFVTCEASDAMADLTTHYCCCSIKRKCMFTAHSEKKNNFCKSIPLYSLRVHSLPTKLRNEIKNFRQINLRMRKCLSYLETTTTLSYYRYNECEVISDSFYAELYCLALWNDWWLPE